MNQQIDYATSLREQAALDAAVRLVRCVANLTPGSTHRPTKYMLKVWVERGLAEWEKQYVLGGER